MFVSCVGMAPVKRAGRSNVCVSGLGSTARKHLWHEMSCEHCETMEKGLMNRTVFLFYLIFFPCDFEHFMDTLSIWSVPCLLLYCSVSRQPFPCCVYCLWLLLEAQPCGRLWSYTCHGSVINLLMIFHQWVILKSSEPFVKPVCNKRKA